MDIENPATVRGLQQGDPEALKAVVRVYLPQVLRAARAAGLNDDQARDAAQETFLVMTDKARGFQGKSKIRTWLFGILYRKVQEARRGLAKDRRETDLDYADQERFHPDGRWLKPPLAADFEVFRTQVREHLDGCLREVPEKQRLAFHLREAEEMASREVCKILDITDTHLGVLLYRARNRLRDCLEERGIRGGIDDSL